MDENKQTVEIIRYIRHEWLNQAQLLKSNLALGRLEDVDRLIDDMVMKARNEGRLTNLNAVKLAAFLLTYNSRSDSLRIDLDVTGPVHDLSHLDNWLVKVVSHVLECYRKALSYDEEERVLVSIQTEPALAVEFDWQGQGVSIDTFSHLLDAAAKREPLLLEGERVIRADEIWLTVPCKKE